MFERNFITTGATVSKDNIHETIAKLRLENSQLKKQIADLYKLSDEKDQKIAKLLDENASLRRKLSLNSNNSSKPPSSDGLKKKNRRSSLRAKGKNKSGGQLGHKGYNLKQSKNPDNIVLHKLSTCNHCQADIRGVESNAIQRRQIFDIPKPSIIVTEHQAEIKICNKCGKEAHSSFPDGINSPVQYGERIKSLATYLHYQQLIPEERLSQTFADIYSLPISSACIATMGKSFAQKVEPLTDQILHFIQSAEVKHADESGFRVLGKTQWLHVLSHEKATHYRFSKKRGDITKTLFGTLVHDHFKPYYKINVKHALCNAHHLRELKSLVEIDKEPWAKKMQKLFWAIAKNSKKKSCSFVKRIYFSIRYDAIINEGLVYHEARPLVSEIISGRKKRRPGHNLLLRLRDFKDDVLLCLKDPLVPFTNNLAEQDIRMIKVKQKISGGFRSSEGAQAFLNIRSFISTTRKQGLNIFESIQNAMNNNFAFEFG